jgi:hypothetical protein
MCRSIKTLHRADAPAADDEVRAAALQFVRKVSGYRVPSRANAEAFEAAVDEIAASCERLLERLAPRRSGSRSAATKPSASSAMPAPLSTSIGP